MRGNTFPGRESNEANAENRTLKTEHHPMFPPRTALLFNILKIVVCIVILEMVWSILVIYRGYFPADFTTDFLQGRQAYFFDSYQYAFYPHIIAGPFTLVFGLLLMSNRFRQFSPNWHRTIGKLQIALVLLVLAPTGFWMAWYAQIGFLGQLGFALLAIVTAATAWFGWQTAMQRKFALHRKWMTRNYVILCSAVVTRLLGGFFLVTGIYGDWTYYLTAWGSWLVPIVIFEFVSTSRIATFRRMVNSTVAHSS